MRKSRVRFTVRRMMVVVIFFGICLHGSLTVWRVYGKSSHAHTFVVIAHDHPMAHPDGFPGTGFFMGIKVPFWTRYWRCLVGQAWNGPGLW